MDLSEYAGKYLFLDRNILDIYDMAAYLESKGLQIDRVIDETRTKRVSVIDENNKKFQVTGKGYVKAVGRDKKKLNEWFAEQKKHQTQKCLVLDNVLLDSFKQKVGDLPFQTWVKRKMSEEIYGVWQARTIHPKKYDLVNDMVLIDDGETISLCHISEFDSRDFKMWTRIPPRSITDKKQKSNK